MIRFDLLRDLDRFIANLAPHQFDLGTTVLCMGVEKPGAIAPGCGAICCAAGWAPSVPSIAATGLVRSFGYGCPMLDGEVLNWEDMGPVFGLPDLLAVRSLFIWAGPSRYDPDIDDDEYGQLTPVEREKVDRSLFHNRIVQFFQEHGEVL